MPFAQRLTRLALTGLTGCAVILALALLHARLAAAAPITAALTVLPMAAAQSGARGTIITHTLRMTNTGSASDVFTLTISGQAWPATHFTVPGRVVVPNTQIQIQLSPGEGRTVAVFGTIPFTTAGGA